MPIVRRSAKQVWSDREAVDHARIARTTDREIRKQIREDRDTALEATALDLRRARVVRPPDRVDVRAIRRRLGLTRPAFAARYGFNLRTLEQWEQGRRKPEGPARLLLRIIDRMPKAVDRALAEDRV